MQPGGRCSRLIRTSRSRRRSASRSASSPTTARSPSASPATTTRHRISTCSVPGSRTASGSCSRCPEPGRRTRYPPAVPYTELHGERIYYEDSGGAGPAVVFSHGFLLDHEMFAPQLEALSGAYRCISWDERGHGASTARKEFTYYDSAADLVALLDLLGIEQATLCGMSQGGFISLRAAIVAPQRVRALALIDTQSGLEDPAMVPAYDAMRDEWLANGPENVKQAV